MKVERKGGERGKGGGGSCEGRRGNSKDEGGEREGGGGNCEGTGRKEGGTVKAK